MTDHHPNTIERFWANVEKAGPDDCWIWKGSFWKHNYGRMKPHGSRHYRRATALSYEINIGPIPSSGPFLCHSCDNPPCVNPRHLWPGTSLENMRDMIAKGRARRPAPLIGSENPNAKLTECQVREIKQMITRGMNNKVIAAQFGVTHSAISLIRLGKKWSQVVVNE